MPTVLWRIIVHTASAGHQKLALLSVSLWSQSDIHFFSISCHRRGRNTHSNRWYSQERRSSRSSFVSRTLASGAFVLLRNQGHGCTHSGDAQNPNNNSTIPLPFYLLLLRKINKKFGSRRQRCDQIYLHVEAGFVCVRVRQ